MRIVRPNGDHAGVDDWVNQVIAVSGTLAGVGLGYLGSLRVLKRQREDALGDRMRDSFSAFLGAMYAAVGELRDLPHVEGGPAVLPRLQRFIRGEAADYVITRRRERATFGDLLRDTAHQVGIAYADLQILPVPDDVRVAVDRAMEYLERLSHDRRPATLNEWTDVYKDLQTAAKGLASPKPASRRRRWHRSAAAAGTPDRLIDTSGGRELAQDARRRP
jgi:hypothetical protein